MDPNTKKDQNEESNSSTGLFASAQVIGQDAMSAFRGETDKVDKAKAASAADELLEAANKDGKLDNTSYGTYVEKAEGYLHQYSGKTKEAEKPTEEAEKPTEKEKPAQAPEKKEEKEEESSGGFGGIMKMAQGFMK